MKKVVYVKMIGAIRDIKSVETQSTIFVNLNFRADSEEIIPLPQPNKRMSFYLIFKMSKFVDISGQNKGLLLHRPKFSRNHVRATQ